MKITIFADFVCPFCYIGGTFLKQALEELNLTDVNIEYKSFQLSPTTQYVEGIDYWEGLAKDKGISLEQIKSARPGIMQMAELANLEFNIDTVKNANTLDAHRLFQYANEQGKGNEFFESVYKAIFTDNLVISDHGVLTDLAEEVGLSREKSQEILSGGQEYKEEVENEILQAGQIGVSGVPFFIFDDKYAVTGAQPKANFIQFIKEVVNKEEENEEES